MVSSRRSWFCINPPKRLSPPKLRPTTSAEVGHEVFFLLTASAAPQRCGSEPRMLPSPSVRHMLRFLHRRT